VFFVVRDTGWRRIAALERLRKLGLLRFQKGNARVDAGITGRGLGIYGPGNIEKFADMVSAIAGYVLGGMNGGGH